MVNALFESLAFAVLTSSSLALSLVACGGDEHPKITSEQMLAYSSDQLDGLDAESSLFVASFDGAQSDSSQEVAANIKANMERLTPAGCANATARDGEVDVVFLECTGPRGLTKITGFVTFTFTAVNPTMIAAHVKSDGLVIGGLSGSIDSDVQYEVDAKGKPSMSVKTGGVSRGALKNTLTRATGANAPYTVSWTDDCLTLDGAVESSLPVTWDEGFSISTGDHDGVSMGTTVSGVVRCGGKCPQSGSVSMGMYPRTIITLDGTASPAFTVRANETETGTMQLACSQ
jgi:hypothetical protein